MSEENRITFPAPEGYVGERIVDAEVIASHEAISFAREAIRSYGTLHAFAARHADARPMAGRGVLYSIPGPGSSRWIVRRLSHGGLLAPLTRDRFLRWGAPRPFNELLMSVKFAHQGIPTPRVTAAIVFPSGGFYRGEVAREEISNALDLAACLFGPSRLERPDRISALRAAGSLLRSIFAAGVIHRDLNLRNLLIQRGDTALAAYILDIEKCSLKRRLTRSHRRRMLARFRRSARRFAERTTHTIGREEWGAFYEALKENS